MGPRESPSKGTPSFAEALEGTKQRSRSATFADHYSQARLFFESQTKTEQKHIADALTFELSKVRTPVIRERIVSHLVNIHEELVAKVAKGLGLKSIPAAAEAAMPTRHDLQPAPTLSIVKNGPNRFEGRKLGILLTEGADAKTFSTLNELILKEGGICELITPVIGGVNLNDGSVVVGEQFLKGAPSVLYDAVALIFGAKGGVAIAEKPEARDFLADAFTHCKFIAFNSEAAALVEKTGLSNSLDEGLMQISSIEEIRSFVSQLGQLRLWKREEQFSD